MALVSTSSVYDVEVSPDNTDAAGWTMAGNLGTRGFCVVKPDLSEAAIEKAIADFEELNEQNEFAQPPEIIVDGLLGSEGSSRIAYVEKLADRGIKCAGLKVVDDAMTDTAALIQDMLPDLGFEYLERTHAVAHETGMPAEETVELTEADAASWLNIFIRAKIMVIFCLGPIKGTLELKPFDEEAEAFEVPTVPGSIIMLRSDMMTCKHFAMSKAQLLTCFMCDATPASKKDTITRCGIPIVQELERWAITRLKQIKEEESLTGVATGDLPEGWSSKMNHMFHTEQRCAVRGMAGRFASTWQLAPWYGGMLPGTDFVTEVPMKRWDVGTYFDPDPEMWRHGKSYLRHGSFADGLELFDCRFFSLSPAEASGMDPHQRVVLEVGYEACHRSGLNKKKLMNSRGGVYLGSGGTIFSMISEVSGATGAAASINSNRFSFCLGMKGPSMTIDTEGSSSLSAAYLGAEGVLEKGRGVHNDFSLAGGIHWILGTVWWPQLQACSLLSKTGRCLAFDASGDGHCFGDGCGFIVQNRLTETVEGEKVWIEGKNLEGIMAAGIMSSNGGGAAMHAPSGAADQEMISEALRNAHLSPECIDLMECDARGSIMADAVEVNAMLRVLRGENNEVPLQLTAIKSRMGFGVENSGITGLLRIMMANKWGVMTPNNHLNQINPYIESENKCNYLDETLEFAAYNMYSGVTAKGFGGTNAHVIMFGESMHDPAPEPEEDEQLMAKRSQILFWPGGGGELEDEQMPLRGYSIAGTFTGWKPLNMEPESGGSYGFTVTMGENRWEEFQILLDADKGKTLHPGQSKGPKTSRVHGPESGVRGLSWRIDGQSQYYEVSAAGGEAASAESAMALQVATSGAGKYYEMASPDTGKVGDKYRVHLKIAGKFRTVTWEKLAEQAEPSDVPSGTYYVVSNWNGWSPETMTLEGQTYSYEVQLQRKGGEFQIVRNCDWGQVICPSKPFADASMLGFGPDEGLAARGFNWYLDGKPGDWFRITLVKDTTSEFGIDNFEVKRVGWERLRSEPLTKAQMAAARIPRFGVVGTWSGFASQSEIKYEGQEPVTKSADGAAIAGAAAISRYSFFVKVGSDAQESFQLLHELDWSRIVHPSTYATSGVPHSVLTSYNDGSAMDLVWTMGGEADGASPGEVFLVKVTAANSRVTSVTWRRASGGPELEEATRQGLILQC